MRFSKLWIDHSRRVKPIRSYSLKTGGKDPVQDRVALGIDYHFILILVEMLNLISLTGETIKG